MPFHFLVDRIVSKLGFQIRSSAQVMRLAESLWARLIQLRPVGECPADPAEARGRIRAYAAVLVRAELCNNGMSALSRDRVEERVVSRLVERFIAERPTITSGARSARVAA